jgi:hypothetical protein
VSRADAIPPSPTHDSSPSESLRYALATRMQKPCAGKASMDHSEYTTFKWGSSSTAALWWGLLGGFSASGAPRRKKKPISNTNL